MRRSLTMKAITIQQPWATLIALGEKQFETRSWKTNHRGTIAIHAGKTIDKEACKDKAIAQALNKHGIVLLSDLPVGVVLAQATLKECHQVILDNDEHDTAKTDKGINITGDEYAFGFYEKGRYAWELANVKALETPIPAKGKLSLWEWEENSVTK